MPWRAARPERGTTRPACPAGMATAIPVPTLARSPGPIVTASAACRSYPGVALVGLGRRARGRAQPAEAQRHSGAPPFVEKRSKRGAPPRARALGRARPRRCRCAPARRPSRAARTASRPRRRGAAAPSAAASRGSAPRSPRAGRRAPRRSRRTPAPPREAEGQLAAALLVDQVHLVEREQARRLPRPGLGQHGVDRLEHRVQLVLGHRRVGHVHDQVGAERLLERRRERLDELVRQLADEPDGVGQQVGAPADLERARGRVERVEEALAHAHVGARERVQQRRLAGVRVAGQRDRRQSRRARARGASSRACSWSGAAAA